MANALDIDLVPPPPEGQPHKKSSAGAGPVSAGECQAALAACISQWIAIMTRTSARHLSR